MLWYWLSAPGGNCLWLVFVKLPFRACLFENGWCTLCSAKQSCNIRCSRTASIRPTQAVQSKYGCRLRCQQRCTAVGHTNGKLPTTYFACRCCEPAALTVIGPFCTVSGQSGRRIRPNEASGACHIRVHVHLRHLPTSHTIGCKISSSCRNSG